MKKTLLLPALILILGQACKKSTGGGTNPGGGHTSKKWLIKSVITKYDDTKFQHVVIKYNDTGRILQIGYGLSGLKDTFDLGVQNFVDYTYDSVTGHLTFMKPNDAPGYKFVYVSAFSIQMTPFPFNAQIDPVSTLNFNAHGNLELDDRISVIPPGGFQPGKTQHIYSYNSLGGLQSESTIDDKSNTQVLWASLGPGVGKPIPNSFAGTSLEQRLVYFTSRFGILNTYDMYGPSWSDGFMEAYSYSTGTKTTISDFGNNYKLDGNGRVIEVDAQYKYPGSSTWLFLPPYYITYEQH